LGLSFGESMPTGEQFGLLMRIAAMGSVSLRERMKS
jgi:hypothetical protein